MLSHASNLIAGGQQSSDGGFRPATPNWHAELSQMKYPPIDQINARSIEKVGADCYVLDWPMPVPLTTESIAAEWR